MWKVLRNIKSNINVSQKELNLKNTLMNGQCFNWKVIDNIYLGTISNNVIAMKEETDAIYYKFLHSQIANEDEFLHNYFQLDISLEDILSSTNLPSRK
jgi:hypothetical protein